MLTKKDLEQIREIVREEMGREEESPVCLLCKLEVTNSEGHVCSNGLNGLKTEAVLNFNKVGEFISK